MLYVKRVVGLPGERVAISGGQVQINGTPLAEPYVRHRRPWDVAEVTLGPREYFVIGDNRGMSVGDHDFGRVTVDRIARQGRVLMRRDCRRSLWRSSRWPSPPGIFSVAAERQREHPVRDSRPWRK